MKTEMPSKKQIRYYKTLQDDFVESSDQEHTLPDDYVWIRESKGARFARPVLYAIGYLFALLYGKLILHLKIVRAVDMKDYRTTGAVVYGNHTQPIGDVFVPSLPLPVLYLVGFVARTLYATGAPHPGAVVSVFLPLLFSNIFMALALVLPIALLLFLYFVCRRKYRRQSQMDKMRIQDL